MSSLTPGKLKPRSRSHTRESNKHSNLAATVAALIASLLHIARGGRRTTEQRCYAPAAAVDATLLDAAKSTLRCRRLLKNS